MNRTTRLKFLAEFAGLKVLVVFIKILPWGLAVKFGEFFGLLLSIIVYKRLNRAVSDIQKAFPHKTPRECKAIAKESFINIGRIAAEFVKASAMSKEELLRHIEFINADGIIEHNNIKNLGGILHIGHFVNWEITGLAAGHIFNKTAFVARPLKNPYADKELTKMRTAPGAVMLNAYNPVFSCIKHLKKGYMIGILSDHSAPDSLARMNFLGRPAEAAVLSTVLAIKMQLPVYPVRQYRKGGKVVIEIQPPMQPPKEYNNDNIMAFTRALMDKYEEWIKQDPSSWLWAHNRWKREEQSRRIMQEQAAQAAAGAQK